jgi:hypothetical protein
MIERDKETESLRSDLSRGRARELSRRLTSDYSKNMKRFFHAFTSGKVGASNPKAEKRLVKRIRRVGQGADNISISELVDFGEGKYFVWQSWAPVTSETDEFGVALMSIEIGVNPEAWKKMSDPIHIRKVLFLRQHPLQRICERSENPESELIEILNVSNLCLRASIYATGSSYSNDKEVLIPTTSGALIGNVLVDGERTAPIIIPNTFLTINQLKLGQRKVRTQLIDAIHEAKEEEIIFEKSSLVLATNEGVTIDDTLLVKELAPIMNKLPRTNSGFIERINNTPNEM